MKVSPIQLHELGACGDCPRHGDVYEKTEFGLNVKCRAVRGLTQAQTGFEDYTTCEHFSKPIFVNGKR